MTEIHKRQKEFPFIITAVNYKGCSDDADYERKRRFPELSLQRLSVYVETKKELDKKLRDIPGGNFSLISKLYKVFDEIIKDELDLVKSLGG